MPSIKEKFHQLIDNLDNENIGAYYDLIYGIEQQEEGILLSKLSQDEKVKLYSSYEKSLLSENLVLHEDVKKLHTRLLRK
jgi:hypothetical protein